MWELRLESGIPTPRQFQGSPYLLNIRGDPGLPLPKSTLEASVPSFGERSVVYKIIMHSWKSKKYGYCQYVERHVCWVPEEALRMYTLAYTEMRRPYTLFFWAPVKMTHKKNLTAYKIDWWDWEWVNKNRKNWKGHNNCFQIAEVLLSGIAIK